MVSDIPSMKVVMGVNILEDANIVAVKELNMCVTGVEILWKLMAKGMNILGDVYAIRLGVGTVLIVIASIAKINVCT
jgi:hypothetical protein